MGIDAYSLMQADASLLRPVTRGAAFAFRSEIEFQNIGELFERELAAPTADQERSPLETDRHRSVPSSSAEVSPVADQRQPGPKEMGLIRSALLRARAHIGHGLIGESGKPLAQPVAIPVQSFVSGRPGHLQTSAHLAQRPSLPAAEQDRAEKFRITAHHRASGVVEIYVGLGDRREVSNDYRSLAERIVKIARACGLRVGQLVVNGNAVRVPILDASGLEFIEERTHGS